jgi:hypothetical protein
MIKNEIVFKKNDNFNQKAPTIRLLKINNDPFKIKKRSSLPIKLITLFSFKYSQVRPCSAIQFVELNGAPN